MNELTATQSYANDQLPWLARTLFAQLKNIRSGELTIDYRGRSFSFGRSADDGLRAKVSIIDPQVFARIVWGGSLGVAEAYIDGLWQTDDLLQTLQIFARDAALLENLDSGMARARMWIAQAYHFTRRNTRSGSHRNIAEHYDLSNDFFARMLDPSMSYSAAIFPSPQSKLHEASLHKIDLLCQLLQLKPSDQLLEIGSGWGALAAHAAQKFGCQVTTTTISQEQFDFTAARIRDQGLSDRVTVKLCDYRDLDGQYDKLVSCEMIEAVGHHYFETFFAKCSSLLLPGGRFALQAITMRDQWFDRAAREVDFIKRYIFPGSCIPSVNALLSAMTVASDLTLRHMADYTPHYARTLSEWENNLLPHRSWVTEKFGERFWRMWTYYLVLCQAGFRERYIGSAQMLFEKAR